ncbi:MAG: hypothetical protein HQM16_03465 [Deltaproteobacteria bacterium]|nr:hypothetical protein [Deltaproteobacteria bacterium]
MDARDLNSEGQKKDKLETMLERYKQEQREFENHRLWKELNTTPEKFFKMVNQCVKNSGIDRRVWEQKLAEAKRVIETRVMEARGESRQVNFRNMRGLRV